MFSYPTAVSQYPSQRHGPALETLFGTEKYDNAMHVRKSAWKNCIQVTPRLVYKTLAQSTGIEYKSFLHPSPYVLHGQCMTSFEGMQDVRDLRWLELAAHKVDTDGAKSPPLALLFHRLQHPACRALSPPLSSSPLPTSPPFPSECALPTCPRCDPIPRSTTTPPSTCLVGQTLLSRIHAVGHQWGICATRLHSPLGLSVLESRYSYLNIIIIFLPTCWKPV
ncbi:hypothetical protein B0H19DRAFT_1264631 [Mycena capillaripes]|nr:hypothetical protein B0H19DRAFT_1264631 [Mycena capillaripes]